MNESEEKSQSVFDAVREAGAEAVVALGAYGLVHAGAVAFLRAGRRLAAGADRTLFAGVVVCAHCATATGAEHLMRPDERVRVLEALSEVDGARLLDESALAGLLEAAPHAIYVVSEDEDDMGPEILAMLREAGVRLERIETGSECTTAALLERMAR